MGRADFVIMAILALGPAVAMVLWRPRLVPALVVVLGVAWAPIKLLLGTGSFAETGLLSLVFALGIVGLGRAVLGVGTKHQARGVFPSRLTNLVAGILLCLMLIATVNTVLHGDAAAGTGVAIAMWPLALLSGLSADKTTGGRGYGHGHRLTKLTKLSLLGAVALGSYYLVFGVVGLISSVSVWLGLSLLGQAMRPHARLVERVGFGFGAVASFATTAVLSPDTQSVLVGGLLGAACMFLGLVSAVRRSRAPRSLFATVIVLSVVAGPLISLLAVYGRTIPIVESAIDEALTSSGESRMNLDDRPARWAALFDEIKREPLRLRFTTFLETEYLTPGGSYLPAFPHNVVLAMGRFLGIPGAVLMAALMVGCIASAVAALGAKGGDLGDSLAALGIIVAFSFRNMWSSMLFVDAAEMVAYWSAVLVAATIARKAIENKVGAIIVGQDPARRRQEGGALLGHRRDLGSVPQPSSGNLEDGGAASGA